MASPPPTYDRTESAAPRATVLTNELMILELEGESIFIKNTNEILFELSQAPLSGCGSAFAVERIIYKTSLPASSVPKIKSRRKYIYDVKDILFTHPLMKPRNTLELSSHGGLKSCLKGPAFLYKGVPFPLFRWIRYGESWHITSLGQDAFLSSFSKGDGREFRDANGIIIAVSRHNPSTAPQLELKVLVDEKTLNALVTLWCAAIWDACRKAKQARNLQEYNKFAPNYSKTKAPRSIRLYGSNIPAALQ